MREEEEEEEEEVLNPFWLDAIGGKPLGKSRGKRRCPSTCRCPSDAEYFEEFKRIASIFCNDIGLDDGAIKDLLKKHDCDTELAAQEAINEFHDKQDKKISDYLVYMDKKRGQNAIGHTTKAAHSVSPAIALSTNLNFYLIEDEDASGGGGGGGSGERRPPWLSENACCFLASLSNIGDIAWACSSSTPPTVPGWVIGANLCELQSRRAVQQRRVRARRHPPPCCIAASCQITTLLILRFAITKIGETFPSFSHV